MGGASRRPSLPQSILSFLGLTIMNHYEYVQRQKRDALRPLCFIVQLLVRLLLILHSEL